MKTDRVLEALLVGASMLGAPAIGSAQPCMPFWSDRFASAGIPYGTIYAMAVYDDGSGRGETLFIGGGFTTAGSVTLNRIARLDGNGWAPLGLGMSVGRVFAFAVFDDGLGNGPALYAGGIFETAGGVKASGIARWDGRAWSAVGTGVDGWVYALAVFDDGSGARPALYVAGSFTAAGGVPAANIARWDGRSWTAVGEGTDAIVGALSVFDDGSGAKLYAGGNFLVAGATEAHHVAAWDGRGWAPLAEGVDGNVRALTVVEDFGRRGPALYTGGFFKTAGGVKARGIARWDRRGWSPVGTGVDGSVSALAVFDDGSGRRPALYVAGSFTSAGGIEAANLARFNGTSWSSVGGGLNGRVTALHVFGDPSAGRRLYVGGSFYSAGDLPAGRIAIWDGSSWSTVDRGIIGSWVLDMEVFDDGSGKGPGLYAAGAFITAGGIATPSIARWDGSRWSALGSGVGDSQEWASALAVFDDGSGPALFVGGHFAHAGGVPANNIARWDGTSWRPVSEGLDVWVRALAVFDDGSGPALYAGGLFQTAGGRPGPLIARWDGTTWSDVGGGLNGNQFAQVRALLVHNDGTGPALFAAGLFDSAGGIKASNIARWNGRTWAPLAQGVQGLGRGFSDGVWGLGIYDDGRGDGPVLLAGGYFEFADGAEFRGPARWNGRAWAPLAKGVSGSVFSFAVYDDGLGDRPALYLAGLGHWIHRYDGKTFSRLGEGLDGPAVALEVFDDGSGDGPSLFVGGDFDNVDGIRTFALSVWVACPGFILGDLDGDGTVGHGDLKLLIGAWGPCPDCDNCLADLDGDCRVAVPDLLTLLANWGLTN